MPGKNRAEPGERANLSQQLLATRVADIYKGNDHGALPHLAGKEGGTAISEGKPVLDRRMQHEQIFNLPQVIVGFVAFVVAIQFAREFILYPETDLRLIWLFSFVPSHYLMLAHISVLSPLLVGSLVWSPVSYGLLHGSWVHVLVNVAWLVAFGTPVARRFGSLRFLLLLVVATIAGALVHLFSHYGQDVPLVGASAGISGVVAAAARFVFVAGPFGRGIVTRNIQVPAPPLVEVVRHRDVLTFVAIWFALNLLVGLLPRLIGAGGASIAWEAHIGGFVAGFVLFRLFDPVSARKPIEK